MPRPETVAIVLAAGLSRRMGARNKLLLPVDGAPMIRRVVQTYFAATGRSVHVITGHQADQVTEALAATPATVHFNPDYAQGQAMSVACGLRVAGPCARLLIGLGDQPHLTANDLTALLQAHDVGDTARISIPRHDGQRGNPIVVPDGLRARLLQDPRAPGCKRFTRAHPAHVQFHDLPNPGFYADIDTPEAYAALSAAVQELTP